MIPHQKMPAANPDPMRRLGVEKPVVTIQTKMNNKLNPEVPVPMHKPSHLAHFEHHLADSLTTTSPIALDNNLADRSSSRQACDHHHGYTTAGERHAARPLAERAGRPRAEGWAAGAPGGA